MLKCVFVPLVEYEALLLKASSAPKATRKMTTQQLWHSMRGNENAKRREQVRAALAEATVVNVGQRQAQAFPENARSQVLQQLAESQTGC
jgi:hypothetical protein